MDTTTIVPDTTTIQKLAEIRALLESGEARDIRIAALLSLSELARAVGVGASTLARWESADRRPRGEAALRYLEVLRAVKGTLVGAA